MVLRIIGADVTYERYFSHDEPREWRKGIIRCGITECPFVNEYLFITDEGAIYLSEVFRIGNIIPFDDIKYGKALFVGHELRVGWDNHHDAYIYNDDGTLYKEL